MATTLPSNRISQLFGRKSKLRMLLLMLLPIAVMANEKLFLTGNTLKSEVTDYMSTVLCHLHSQIIYVYFEDDLETDIHNDLLDSLNECQVAPIKIFEIGNHMYQQAFFNDDGVQMYLVLLLNEPYHTIKHSHVLRFLKKKSADKYRSKVFVVIEKPFLPKRWIKGILDLFWERCLLHVVIIFWNDQLNIYTYNPFSEKSFLRLPPNTTAADELFYDKLNNLNGKQVRVSLFPEEVRAIYSEAQNQLAGQDGFFAEVLKKKMNATFTYVLPSDNQEYGRYFKNGSSSGALHDVITNAVDFSINARYYIIEEFHRQVEVSYTNGKDDICFLLPKRKEGSHLANLFKSFEKPVWIAVVTSIFAMAMMWTFIETIERVSLNAGRICMDLYRINFGQPILRAPLQLSAKFMVAFWMLYSLLITNSFKCNLTSSLALPAPINDIETIDELIAAPGIKILANAKFYKYTHLHLRLNHRALMAKLVSVPDEVYFENLNSNNGTVGFVNKMHLTNYWAMKKSFIVNGQPIYHAMPECIVPYLSTYIFPYGSPFIGKFNSILRRLQESGIFLKWEQVTDQLQQMTGRKVRFHKHTKDEFQQLKIYHLEGAFYLLLFGLALASVVFVGELVHNWNELKQVRKKVLTAGPQFPFVN